MKEQYAKEVKGSCYIITNNREVVECIAVKRAGGFVTLRFRNRNGGVRLRESRVYSSLIEANEALRSIKEKNSI